MEHLLKKMFADIKRNKKNLIAFKNLAVKTQNYELAVEIRLIEKNLFPESKEVSDAKKLSKELNLLFRMVNIGIDDETCWLIYHTLDQYKKTKGSFSIKHASVLLAKQEEIFDLD